MRKTEDVKFGGKADRKDKGRIGEKGIWFDKYVLYIANIK